MRRRRHQRSASVLVGAFVTSILVHALVAYPVREAVDDYLSRGSSAQKPVRMVRLSPDAWSKSMLDARVARAKRPDLKPTEGKRVTSPAEAKRAEAKAEKKKEPEDEGRPRGQIVEVPPTADDRPNPEAKYLSKYNTHVDRETTARPDLRDSKKSRVTNKLQEKEQVGQPENALKTRGLTVRGDNDVLNKEGKAGEKGEGEQMFKLEMPNIQRRDSVELKLSDIPGRKRAVTNRTGSDEVVGNSDHFELQLGKGKTAGEGDGGGKIGDKNAPDAELPSLAALAPTIGTIARISGSPSRDYVEGVTEGDGTFLNTKEFKHATFFYRVRDSVAGYWEDLASREYRRRDPSGNIYGVRDRSTLLHIQLAPDGRLANVRVEQTSGVDFLDAVAVQAFRMAEPFPNPPAAIVDADGRIRFNFQFVVTMRPRSPVNLFNFR